MIEAGYPYFVDYRWHACWRLCSVLVLAWEMEIGPKW